MKALILFFALIIPSQSQGASSAPQLFLNLLGTVSAARSGEVDSGTIKVNSPDASSEFLDKERIRVFAATDLSQDEIDTTL